MKKTILATFAALLVAANGYSDSCYQAPEFNANNIYVKATTGVNFANIKKPIKVSARAGYLLSGAVGYRLESGPRLEAEYAYRSNSKKNRANGAKLNFRVSSIMVNALIDLPLGNWVCPCSIKPFIGAGIGASFQKLSVHNYNTRVHGHKNDFAWQIIAGADYELCSNLDLTVEYKYNRTNRLSVNNNSIATGLTYNF